nr:phospholipase A1-II 4-like [Ipomoea batatas]
MSGIADRWSVLSGSDNWEGLLEPLDSDLRRYLIHYGTMIEPARDAFIQDDASKNVGLPRYARRNLFQNTGLLKGNPFKYEVTKYFYATSELAIWKESDWIGYVAVATDEGKVALGRRDIVVVWRGTIRELEWIDDAIFLFVNAPLIFGQNSDPLVHEGWHYMYTTTTDKDNGKSPRDQIREEVARLVELYKDEEVSITVIGHSLGSSMATLNAVDLAVNPINNNNNNKDVPITAFLYASPKTPQGTIERKGVFDLAKVNKYQDSLIEDYRIRAEWFNIKDKGMVQLEDGNYILDDHEPDDNEVF